MFSSDELLQANDAMQTVIQRYTTVVIDGQSDTVVQRPMHDALPAIAAATNPAISNTDLLTAIMSDAPLSADIIALTALPEVTDSPAMPETTLKPADELGTLDAIFTSPTTIEPRAHIVTDSLLLANATPHVVGHISDMLSPINATPDMTTSKRLEDKSATKPLSELDMFGLDSVITGLKNNLVSQADKCSAVTNANEDPVSIAASKSNNTPVDYDVLSATEDDDDILLQSGGSSPPRPASNIVPATPLADLHIDLATIQPSPMPARIILDDRAGLKIALHFALDRPRADCSVYVLTVTNQTALPMRSLTIDASVSKPCKVRLLPPSGTNLPACKPFRPPTEDVTQLLLVANPTARPTDMCCMVSYNLGDDPDATKESIVVSGLPAVN